MLRKGIAAAALIAASTSVFAGGPEVAPAYIGGVYVDVGLSRDDVVDSYRQNTASGFSLTTEAAAASSTGPNYGYRADAGAPGWDGLVGFGYNYVWDNEWSVGLELFGDVSSAHGTQLGFANGVNLRTGSVTSASYVNLRAERTVGVSLLPGYYVAPGSMYFMELGYVNTDFHLTGFPDPYVGNFANPSREVDESGFRLGVGTTTQVGSHVAIRQEYVWEVYGNVNARRNHDVTATAGGTTLRIINENVIRVSPEIGKYNLAAVYYFASQGNAPDLHTAPAHVGGNFYAGLNGSYDGDYSHTNYYRDQTTVRDATGAITSDVYDFTANGLMKITGWNVGLLAGYGFNFSNRWYAGVEVFGNWDDVDGRYNEDRPAFASSATVNGVTTITTNAGYNINSRLEKAWDFGAAFIPGYQVSDNALLYARVGYVGAEFEIHNNWVGNTNYTAAENAVISRGSERWLNGLQLGVGVDTVVYNNLSLRTEFNINNYGNYNVTRIARSTTVSGVNTTHYVSTTHEHNIEDQLNVALIWHFFG